MSEKIKKAKLQELAFLKKNNIKNLNMKIFIFLHKIF